jgi:hypothetical protein
VEVMEIISGRFQACSLQLRPSPIDAYVSPDIPLSRYVGSERDFFKWLLWTTPTQKGQMKSR